MLNKEKFAKEIEDILAKTIAVSESGKIYKCTDRGNCKDCIFCDVACVDGARNWLNSEYKEQILDDAEKRYLRGVIRPFRDKVKSITKFADTRCTEEYIYMVIEGPADACLPRFDGNTMYKGMELNREYTLEELGL